MVSCEEYMQIRILHKQGKSLRVGVRQTLAQVLDHALDCSGLSQINRYSLPLLSAPVSCRLPSFG